MIFRKSKQQQDAVCDRALTEVAKGNTDALVQIYRAYGRMIFSVAVQFLGNSRDAEDLLQDVMLQIMQKADSYRSGTNPRAWIMTITRNLALNKLKKERETVSIDGLEDYELPDALVGKALGEDMLIRDALRRLTDEEQLIVKLKLYVGLTHGEIGAMMDLTEDAAQKRYERAMGKLRRYFDA